MRKWIVIGAVLVTSAIAGVWYFAASWDPRLEVLEVSRDNGLIEFVKNSNGKVIMEIDRDPASARFGKPSREYTYSGNRVVGLTIYEVHGEQTEVTRFMVSYKPDGSIQAFSEQDDSEPTQKSR